MVPADVQAKTTFVTIGTGGITGVYYPTGGAIAKMVNAKRKEYGIRATVESTGGSVFNVNAVMSGDLEFGVVQSDRQYQAMKGMAEWEGKPQKDLRAVFSIHPESVTLAATLIPVYGHQGPEGQTRQYRQSGIRTAPELH
jgi:TRAP transporter TAXI family solute receptor